MIQDLLYTSAMQAESISALQDSKKEYINAFFSIAYDSVLLDEALLETLLDSPIQDTLPTLGVQAYALLLSHTQHNHVRYMHSNVFQAVLALCAKDFEHKETETLSFIQALQALVLNTITIEMLKPLKAMLLRINASGLLDNTQTRALLELCDNMMSVPKEHTQNDSTSASLSLSSEALADELDIIIKTIIQSVPSTKLALETITKNLADNHFSIGVVGILSAGKSTFLNALLGKALLGTSTIPETASLTILKYAPKEYAQIYFWSEQEWRESRESFLESSATPPLSDEALELLKVGTKDIDLSELARYTSANHPSAMCDIVARVEIYTPLTFLQNNVEIVDTPGLDDPIIKREEMTKAYMQHCDLLIYVMNASCAATKKDMDFILETLTSGHISRLLVVLTRSDLLSEKELESSLAYTRASLTKELQKMHYEEDTQALLDRIDFIALSGFYALAYKTKDQAVIAEAQQKGFDFEKTGITKIESYLESMLLGSDSKKRKEMLYSAYKQVAFLVQKELSALQVEIEILQASSKDRTKILDNLEKEHTALLESQETLKSRLLEIESEFSRYLNDLGALITAHLRAHIQRLHTQLYDDALYEYARSSTPSLERIHSIIKQALSDSTSDLVREYKYKVAKKITTLGALLESMIEIKEDNALCLPNITYTNQTPHIARIAQALSTQIHTLCASHTKSTQERLQGALESSLVQGIEALSTLIAQENARIQASLQEGFMAFQAAQESKLQARISESKDRLDSAISRANKGDTKTYIATNITTQKTLKTIQHELQIIIEALR